MDTVMRLVPLLTFLLSIASITLSLCNGNPNVPCRENERQTLLMFKKDLDDSSDLLSSWVAEGDCCTWTGVACDNLTGHVRELHLAGYYDEETREDRKLGGNKLCGPPLEEHCSTNEAMPPVGDEKHREGHLLEDSGFYLSLGLGFAFGFWIVLGSLLSNLSWSNAFSQFQNRLVKKFYAAIVERY